MVVPGTAAVALPILVLLSKVTIAVLFDVQKKFPRELSGIWQGVVPEPSLAHAIGSELKAWAANCTVPVEDVQSEAVESI